MTGGRAFDGVVLLARGVLLTLAMLLACSLAPTAFGLRSDIVMSGSMTPALRPGDALLTVRVPAAEVEIGAIVLMANPVRPATTLVHRAAGRTDDGALLTKGDANAAADSTPVPAAMVIGKPRVRVPYVGLPIVWWSERDLRSLALFGAGTLVLILLAGSDRVRPAAGYAPRHRRRDTRPAHRHRARPAPASNPSSEGIAS